MECNDDNTKSKRLIPIIVIHDNGDVSTTIPIKRLLDAADVLRELPEEEGQLLAQAVITALFCIVCDHSEFLETGLALMFEHVRGCADPEMVNLLLPPDQLKEALKQSRESKISFSGFPSKGTPTCQ